VSSAAAMQTAWAELVVATLADAGVRLCVVSPGSRSTPLVAALAGEPRITAPAIIDERAAAFYALGAARASGEPVALVCTSGTAAAHWLPALVEASEAAIPLVAITADRPAELQGCGAPQTIDQVKLFGGFVRAYLDLGAPDAGGGALALRAVRRKVAQAVTTARGPHPGPVHVEVPLRKPLEPVALDPAERARERELIVAPPPRTIADDTGIAVVAAALARAERPLVIAGPARLDAAARAAVHALARAAGAVLLAETASQLRLGAPPELVTAGAFDPILAARARELAPDVIVQLGAEPVAAAWPQARATWAAAARYVLAPHAWTDPDSSARAMILGDVGDAARRITAGMPAARARDAWHAAWREAEAAARAALDAAADGAPDGEPAIVRAVLGAAPPDAFLVVGNSLPARVIDHVARASDPHRDVIVQRGACGIDGLVAGAAGATWTGRPVVAVIGDVSFAHDLGGVAAAARACRAPLAVVVVDNGGGRIFDGLPVAGALAAPVLADYFHTPPGLDPAAVARAVGAAAITATSPAAVADGVRAALGAPPGLTVIHAPVAADGAHRARASAVAALAARDPSTSRGARP
jgi:2-succinyl-5-enolpyruvyl-6-hydroxy-3-cyclohexene-1-carboxylate synthase